MATQAVLRVSECRGCLSEPAWPVQPGPERHPLNHIALLKCKLMTVSCSP